MNTLTYYAAGRSEQAGRQANMDAMLLCPDLGSRPLGRFTATIDLSAPTGLPGAGILMAVADGGGIGGATGGYNPAEMVINSIARQMEALPASALTGTDQAAAFLQRVVATADRELKQTAAAEAVPTGLACTLAIMWLLGDKAICLWCGDCRIYRFNAANGLARLSHDHTYIQQLVDTGKLDREAAFGHPDAGIITRSIGENARPQVAVYQVFTDDMFMLVTDGVTRHLPDSEISDIMRHNNGYVPQTLSALWRAVMATAPADNVTILLCGTSDGGKRPGRIAEGYPEPQPASRPLTPVAPPPAPIPSHPVPKAPFRWRRLELAGAAVAAAALVVWAILASRSSNDDEPNTTATEMTTETTATQPDSTKMSADVPDATATTPPATQAQTSGNSVHSTSTPKTTAPPASFTSRMASLSARRSEMDNMMLDGVMTPDRRRQIEQYTASIAAVAAEASRKQYTLSADQSAELDALQSQAAKLRRYLQQSAAE